MKKSKGPKILVFDVETAPIIGYVWGLWENNVALNQIKSDWHILSWAAKWLDDPKVMYMDQRNAKNVEDDSKTLLGIWKLLDEADVVITQNGKQFDSKKLNARFIMNGFKPPSPYEHIDTKQIASKHFAFTSNKLEYLTDKLNKKFKKIKHEEFGGFELWKECLKGNIKAWKELEKYNKHDVLSTEELYKALSPWTSGVVNFNVYSEETTNHCKCGETHWVKSGFKVTRSGRYQQYKCQGCGSFARSKVNVLSKEKRKALYA